MTDETPQPSRRQYYWQHHTDGQNRWRKGEPPPGAELAALRRGMGKEPGSVPEMWAFYTRLNAQGTVTPALRAEHLALTLFALHQQSKSQPMHCGGIGLGAAVRALHRRFSEDAVDRRFTAAATATSAAELAMHLRGLVSQLRVVSQPLDYTRLLADLQQWQEPEGAAAVRRRWGAQYFVRPAKEQAGTVAGPSDQPDNVTASA